VIQAWAKQGKADEAAALVQEMSKQQQRRSNVAPNIYTNTAVGEAYCQSRQPEKAQAWIQQNMLPPKDVNDGDAKTNENQVYPNVVTFTILINGWSKMAQEQPEKAVENVLNTLDQMKRLAEQQPQQQQQKGQFYYDNNNYHNIAPNELTYTAVLKNIAQARLPLGPRLAATVMKDLLMQLPSTLATPSHTCYPTFIHFNAWLDTVAKAPYTDKSFWTRCLRATDHGNK
jgi:hypothetical protein